MWDNALASLTKVAAAGAVTLVRAMATDAWREVQERVAGLLSRGDLRRQALQRQILEESRRRIRSAPHEQRQATCASERTKWEAALRLALVFDPKLALDLAILAHDLVTQLPPPAGDAIKTPQSRLVALADRGWVGNPAQGLYRQVRP